MKITASTTESLWQLHLTQSSRHRSRRGTMMLWSVWVFLAMLMIVAGLCNVMWLSCTRAEARRQAESAVIAGGHAFLSDDLLRPWQQPFENDGRAVRSRNAVVDYIRQSGDNSLSRLITAGDVELVQPPAATQPGNTGLTQPGVNVPDQIRLIFGKDQSNDQVRMFFSGLTGVQYARLGVTAAATIEHTPVGFLPGGSATIPVLPLAIPDQSQDDSPMLNAGGLWSQQIESGTGSDNLSWNPEQHSVENGPDGLPEITLTLSPNSAGNAPDSFVPLRFAATPPAGNVSQTVQWMQNGVTADDLKTLGLSQLAFPSTLSATTLSNTECTQIAAWLRGHTGQSFMVCLCSPATGAAKSQPQAADNELSTVQLIRPVAARIMASEVSAGGEVRIRLQPCVLITSTAVTSNSPQATLNRYLYSVRLCE
jgi:hypothetical protein